MQLSLFIWTLMVTTIAVEITSIFGAQLRSRLRPWSDPEVSYTEVPLEIKVAAVKHLSTTEAETSERPEEFTPTIQDHGEPSESEIQTTSRSFFNGIGKKMSKRKAPSDITNPNHDLCEFLMELADYEKSVSRNIHKYNAYRKAASALAKYGTRIKSGDEAKKLDGIGDKISKKIDEFLDTGKLRKLDNIRSNTSSVVIKELTRVSGIGPAKAKELYNSGVTNIELLLKNQEKLNHHQKLGLKYLTDFEQQIPRSEIVKVEQIIKKTLYDLDPSYKITICGSYRRGKDFSGDIDTLISHPTFTSKDLKKKSNKLQVVVDVLKKKNLITETIALGDSKFMGVCKVNKISRRLDIRFNPYDQFYCAVLYFTGSAFFNKQMRDHALRKGFTLNEYTLRPIGSTGIPGEPVEITCEKDIFDYLDYPYKKPEERN